MQMGMQDYGPQLLSSVDQWGAAAGAGKRLAFDSQVKVLYLKSKPELNQRIGKVKGWTETGRIVVRVEGTAEGRAAETGKNEEKSEESKSEPVELALQRMNLFPVGIRDLKTGGEILGPVDAERRSYRVALEDGSEESVPVADLEYSENTLLVVRELQGAPQWNGRSGAVTGKLIVAEGADPAEGRYQVAMSARAAVKIKREKLFL
jgi:hypothetical protein